MLMAYLYISKEEFLNNMKNIDMNQLDIIESVYSLSIYAKSCPEEQREEDASFLKYSSINMLVFICEIEIENFESLDNIDIEDSLKLSSTKKETAL